jgi:hypothetical protein
VLAYFSLESSRRVTVCKHKVPGDEQKALHKEAESFVGEKKVENEPISQDTIQKCLSEELVHISNPNE